MESWPINPSLAEYGYERGEGRFKHKWKYDRAGFVPPERAPIGKCHRSIDQATAEHLLASGFPGPDLYGDREEGEAPDVVYNVYRGVPYVAVPTRAGKTYHGYPWRGRMPASVKKLLRERATEEGTASLREFEKWMDEYSE